MTLLWQWQMGLTPILIDKDGQFSYHRLMVLSGPRLPPPIKNDCLITANIVESECKHHNHQFRYFWEICVVFGCFLIYVSLYVMINPSCNVRNKYKALGT